MSDAVLLAIIASIQGVSTAWINWQVKKYACGGPKCIQAITEALKIDMSGHRER